MNEILHGLNGTSRLPQQAGRSPSLYTYDIVSYGGKEYAVVTLNHIHSDIRFVIDSGNLTEVLSKCWHLSSGRYIATQHTLPDGKSKEVCLHNLLKDTCMSNAHNKVVIHINNNMLDNRVENLRLVDTSEYFPVRNNRKRRITLPPDCGFTVDDIPKYVSFMKATGEHGDRFAIEIPQLNIFQKLPSSKKIALKDKFEEVKRRLREIYETHPDIDPQADDELKLRLNTSLDYILSQAEIAL
jgi:hypothetical protein